MTKKGVSEKEFKEHWRLQKLLKRAKEEKCKGCPGRVSCWLNPHPGFSAREIAKRCEKGVDGIAGKLSSLEKRPCFNPASEKHRQWLEEVEAELRMTELNNEFDREYFEGGEYGSYEELEGETKRWYSEVLSLADIESGRGKALDVGCAYGYSLEVLSNLGFEPFGMDASEYAVGKGRSIHDFPLAVGDVERGIPFDENFSLITMVDTLEHLENPGLAVSNVYEKLSEGGIFVASTPNPRWWRNYLGLAPEDETHVNVWPPEGRESALAGFEWSELEVKPLQTVPVIWRVLDRPAKFRFPFGEIVHIRGVK